MAGSTASRTSRRSRTRRLESRMRAIEIILYALSPIIFLFRPSRALPLRLDYGPVAAGAMASNMATRFFPARLAAERTSWAACRHRCGLPATSLRRASRSAWESPAPAQVRGLCRSGNIGSAGAWLVGSLLEALESIADNAFKQAHFFIAQLLELILTAPLGERTFILPDKHHQVLGNPVRHLDRIHDAADGFVVTPQIVDLARQILLDGAPDAGIQKLRRFRAVEIPIQIGGRVEHLDVALGCRPPLDKRHERAGVGLQGRAVILDAVQHHGRNR